MELVTKDELREIIHNNLKQFVGLPNNEETKKALAEMMTELFIQFPDKIEVIADILQESQKMNEQEFIPEQTDASCPNCGVEHQELCYHTGHGQYFCETCWDRESQE